MRTARRATGRLVVLAVAVLAVVIAVAALLPGLGDLNPFGTETKDRTQPAVVRSLERMDSYRAATANLQVVVDVEQDASFLPSFIKGSKTLLVANGNVDAGVSLRGLRGDAVKVSDDRRSVTLTLPGPTLSEPRLDLGRTRVFDTDRGIVDRIGEALGNGGADEERQLLELAERKLAEAAAADANLLVAAERNTRDMLTALLRGLGFERIDVRFDRRATSAGA